MEQTKQKPVTQKPLTLQIQQNLGLGTMIDRLIEQGSSRQSTCSSPHFLRRVMKHLIGATLDAALGPNSGLQQHSLIEGNTRSDFDIGDTTIHVSPAPNEELLHKCQADIQAGGKPTVITLRKRTASLEGLAENAGIASAIDIIEFEQFIATNIHTLSRFTPAQRRAKIDEIIKKYNEIIDEHETDPGLKIEIALGK